MRRGSTVRGRGELDTLEPGVRFGPYEVLGLVSAGGMGEVYRARDTRLDRVVAVKVLPSEVAADPVSRARFEREARAISAVAHSTSAPSTTWARRAAGCTWSWSTSPARRSPSG